jgi:alanyl-tRNA synthetase
VTRLRAAERELTRFRSAQLLESSGELAAGAENAGGIAFVAHQAPGGTDADAMRKLALDVRSKIPARQPAVIMIAGVPADRPVVVIAVNEAGRGLRLAAGALVGVAAKALGGGGGGKPDIAQGGGAPNAGAGAVNAAFDAVRNALQDSGRTSG